MLKIARSLSAAVVTMGIALATTACGPAPEPKKPPPPPPPQPTATAEAKPKFKFEMERGALKLPGPVVFETGSDKLKPESDTVLEVVKSYLDEKKDVTLLRIEGHTDNDGLAADNQKLSEKRAMAVAKWLIARGEKCDRLLPVGFGQTRPIAGAVDKQTADEKTQNRRVAFVNAAVKGKAIGGMPVDGGGTQAGDPCK